MTESDSKLRVLHLIGLDDSCTAEIRFLSRDPRRMSFRYRGNVDLGPLVDPEQFQLISLVCGDVPGEPGRVPRLDVALNSICDPDTNQASLRIAQDVIDGLGIGVVNPPAAIARTTRDGVARALADLDGLVVPAVRRLAPTRVADVGDLVDGGTLRLPFLFREVGSHGGEGLIRIDRRDQLVELERFAFDGREFYASDFVDVRSADGLFRKYRVLVVGNRAHRKHCIIGDDWMIHSRSREFMADRPDLQAEEDAWVTSGVVGAGPFAAMKERLGLDYFGVDFGLLPDGRLVLFEVNACARALRGGNDSSEIASHAESTTSIKERLAALLVERSTQRRARSSADGAT